MQYLIILMSFLDQVVTIGPKQPIDLFLHKEEIFPTEHIFHDSLHQID